MSKILIGCVVACLAIAAFLFYKKNNLVGIDQKAGISLDRNFWRITKFMVPKQILFITRRKIQQTKTYSTPNTFPLTTRTVNCGLVISMTPGVLTSSSIYFTVLVIQW